MEHQNWDYTVFTKTKGTEKGDKAINKAIRDGKDVETIKKGLFSIFSKFSKKI